MHERKKNMSKRIESLTNTLYFTESDDIEGGIKKSTNVGEDAFVFCETINAEFTWLKEEQDWSDGFRHVWVSDVENVIFTYCEGDVSLCIYENKGSYERAYTEANAFYKDF